MIRRPLAVARRLRARATYHLVHVSIVQISAPLRDITPRGSSNLPWVTARGRSQVSGPDPPVARSSPSGWMLFESRDAFRKQQSRDAFRKQQSSSCHP
eukprot:3644787-Prymnesium_polylepis.1